MVVTLLVLLQVVRSERHDWENVRHVGPVSVPEHSDAEGQYQTVSKFIFTLSTNTIQGRPINIHLKKESVLYVVRNWLSLPLLLLLVPLAMLKRC